jgi:transposase
MSHHCWSSRQRHLEAPSDGRLIEVGTSDLPGHTDIADLAHGRDGFWLARWLKARGIEAHVSHASSVAVSREHRRAKTDRLDTELLKRAFMGCLRAERDHCKTAAIPSLREEDAKRPSRERESLVGEQSPRSPFRTAWGVNWWQRLSG